MRRAGQGQAELRQLLPVGILPLAHVDPKARLGAEEQPQHLHGSPLPAGRGEQLLQCPSPPALRTVTPLLPPAPFSQALHPLWGLSQFLCAALHPPYLPSVSCPGVPRSHAFCFTSSPLRCSRFVPAAPGLARGFVPSAVGAGVLPVPSRCGEGSSGVPRLLRCSPCAVPRPPPGLFKE